MNSTYFLKAALKVRKHKGEVNWMRWNFSLVKGEDEVARTQGRRLKRSVNEGFSGGEKKRRDFPDGGARTQLAILDETDSGLDIDALKVVAGGVNKLHRPDAAQLVITHYQRLLNFIVPDFVHVMADGRIVKSGGKELALNWNRRVTGPSPKGSW